MYIGGMNSMSDEMAKGCNNCPARSKCEGLTVIVTGASGGMGKGIAESLIVDHGCTVIGIARSKELEHYAS